MHTESIIAALRDVIPHADLPDSLEVIGEGFGSLVVGSKQGVILRVPKTPESARRMQMSDRLMPCLQPHLSVRLPEPLWYLQSAPHLPYGASAYRYIPGNELAAGSVDSGVARQVGTVLAAIHAVTQEDLDPVRSLIPDHDAVAQERDRVMDIALPWLRHTQPTGVVDGIAAWFDGFRRSMKDCPAYPRLVHGDFWYGNLLVDDRARSLVAILDWDQASLDDPAQDLATLLHFEPAFVEVAMAAYLDAGGVIDASVIARRDLLWQYREFTGLAIAIELEDGEEIADAIRKLRAGAMGDFFL